MHPKLRSSSSGGASALGPEGGIDWAHAEALALALAAHRRRADPAHRAGHRARHLQPAPPGAARREHRRDLVARCSSCPGALAPFELHNSPLSELATLGFEYGYSAAAPEALVLWEAQFGDFVNGAQVIVDQFLASGLSKWGLTTRLTLLLPHGYEGQGPEHSSARLERFLQLAAEGNIRVANCTTPAQYFHLLRRQARRTRQRPLVVMTPKSLLRLPQATSHARRSRRAARLQPVLDDPSAAERARQVTRVVLCTGKVYYDLLAEAAKQARRRPAIVRLEQLYTFPEPELRGDAGALSRACRSWSGPRRSRGTWARGPTSSRSCASCSRRASRCAMRAARAGEPGRGISRGARGGAEADRRGGVWPRREA